MTELSFLLDLLLNHKLPKGTKEAIVNRVKEIESKHGQNVGVWTQPAQPPRPPRTAQSPSTQRILDEMAAEHSIPEIASGNIAATLETPAVIAQTPAAAAALAARQEAIRIAVSGKEEKGRTSPRKF